MDRKPLPPPFPVGARLRYVGPQSVYVQTGDIIRITEAVAGYTALSGPVDGYNYYHVAPEGYKPTKRVIWLKDAHEWEVVD